MFLCFKGSRWQSVKMQKHKVISYLKSMVFISCEQSILWTTLPSMQVGRISLLQDCAEQRTKKQPPCSSTWAFLSSLFLDFLEILDLWRCRVCICGSAEFPPPQS